VISAKAKLAPEDSLTDIECFCADNQVKFLIARCLTSDVKMIHAMEARGYQLMDTLLYLRNDLESPTPALYSDEFNVELLNPSDIPLVVKIAEESFTAYKGHYHNDPRLDPVKAMKVYGSWAERCCIDPSVASCVLVAKNAGKLVGFLAIRINSSKEAEFILAGVTPAMRGKGIYRAFVIEGLNWCKAAGVSYVLNSTLLINIAVQKVCTKLGFYVMDSYHTFHKWFD